MAVLNAVMDTIEARLTFVKHRVLGENNERLDFVMDSFYKMEPRQKNFVLAGIVAAIVCFIAFAVFFYIAQIGALETRLNESFAALHTLQEQKTDFGRVNGKFNVIVKDVTRLTQGLKMKPLLEKFARGLNIKIEGLSEAGDVLASDNPMSKFLEQRKIEVRLPRVSLPKLLKFLVEVEKARKFLRISDLTIRGIYGTKLYFDAAAVINWYRGA